MVWDGALGTIVLYGGTSGTLISSDKPDDTWQWDGQAWMQTNTTGPGGRIYHALVYDSTRHVIVLFGGATPAGNYSGQTWLYNGTAWALSPASGPSARNGAGMAFDSQRSVAVLFGGYDGTMRFNDTWEWSGDSWDLRSPGTVSDPPGRIQAPLAYDEARHVVVMFGGNGPSGYLGDTWEYTGATGTWVQRTTAPPPDGPLPRANPGFTYDPIRHVTVMFGGQEPGTTGNDVWEWDGASWAPEGASGPGARYNAPLAYDRLRSRLVLFGGHIASIPPTTNGETWVMACAGPGLCYPNCDGSLVPPVLNVLDFNCFLNRFSAGESYANCDGSSTPPVLNVLDFNCFLNAFSAGCP
jgi:hypothetical protein